MRNYRIRILTLVILLSFFSLGKVPLGYAEETLALGHDYAWSDKLSRGVLNVISSPVEIARTIDVERKDKGNGYGWTVGLIKGFGRTFLRLGLGAVEVLTFPFNFPDEHKAPLMSPEFVWQKWDRDYKDSTE